MPIKYSFIIKEAKNIKLLLVNHSDSIKTNTASIIKTLNFLKVGNLPRSYCALILFETSSIFKSPYLYMFPHVFDGFIKSNSMENFIKVPSKIKMIAIL